MLIKDDSIDPDRINGLSLTSSYVTEEIDKFLDMSDNELMIHYPQVLKRIKTIKQGMMIVRFLIENKNLSELVFTTFGLRHGVLGKGYLMSLDVKEEYFQRGDKLFSQGDKNNGVFIVNDGEVAIVKNLKKFSLVE